MDYTIGGFNLSFSQCLLEQPAQPLVLVEPLDLGQASAQAAKQTRPTINTSQSDTFILLRMTVFLLQIQAA